MYLIGIGFFNIPLIGGPVDSNDGCFGSGGASMGGGATGSRGDGSGLLRQNALGMNVYVESIAVTVTEKTIFIKIIPAGGCLSIESKLT